MDKTIDIFVGLLRNAITGAGESFPQASDEQIREMYDIAKKHNILPIFCLAASRSNLTSDEKLIQVFKREIYTAALRNDVILKEFSKICNVLEKEKIPYLPLKGSVIRDYYPQEWMRSSRDIDILVKQEDLHRAGEALYQQCGYLHEKDWSNAIIMNTPQGICFELHYTLLAGSTFPKAKEYLDNIWNMVSTEKGFRMKMDNETLFYYHIVHTAKHFNSGTGGIRPLTDLWLMKQKINYDEAKLNSLLEKSDLLKFFQAMEKMTEIWFGDAEHTEETRLVEKFIFEGGIDGDRNITVSQNIHRHKGKHMYILSKVFVPFATLKGLYPVLDKCVLLAPFCVLHRIFSFLFGQKKERRKETIAEIKGISKEKLDSISSVWDIVEFKEKN